MYIFLIIVPRGLARGGLGCFFFFLLTTPERTWMVRPSDTKSSFPILKATAQYLWISSNGQETCDEEERGEWGVGK